MNEIEWRARRDDRTRRYAGRVLDPNKPILISADRKYAERYDGQTAIITAANLFSRMTPSVFLDVPDVRVVPLLHWKGESLREVALETMRRSDPFGKFDVRSNKEGDYVVRVCSTGTGRIIHGSGWNVYIGEGPSPVEETNETNPIGPALAVIVEAANIFMHEFKVPNNRFMCNAFLWTENLVSLSEAPVLRKNDLGAIWTVGTGSVGTSIIYFLALTGSPMFSTLFDMDSVEIENLDRSPIFGFIDVGLSKVEVTRRFLESLGYKNTKSFQCALHESKHFSDREQGVPDIIISTANELNVRSTIEASFPPIQIYGTTGQDWQASVFRHIPLVDPCSCCLFTNENYAQTKCATGTVKAEGREKQVDASLPFLSFAAGLMAAAEVLKLQLPNYPFNENRTLLYTWGWPRITQNKLIRRKGCVCESHSINASTHKKMIAGSKYFHLSG